MFISRKSPTELNSLSTACRPRERRELVLDNIKHHQLLIFNRSYFSSKFKPRLKVADLCAQTLKVMDQCARSHTLPQHMKQCRPPRHAIEKAELRMSHSLGHHLPPDCKTSWLRLQCIRDLVKTSYFCLSNEGQMAR